MYILEPTAQIYERKCTAYINDIVRKVEPISQY